MTGERQVYARIVQDRLFRGLVVLLSFMSLVPLFLILYYIGRKGISAINWGFFTSLPAPVGEAGGGISNALVGTVMLIAVACAIAVPLGIAAGMFLSEHGKSKLAYLVRLVVEVQTKSYPAIRFCRSRGLTFCGYSDHYWPSQDIALFFGESLR